MKMQGERFNGDARVLHRRAVRTPLPDEDAERLFHENMMRVADAQERKAEMLADPDIPLLTAYEEELDRLAESFRHRLRRTAGDDYREVAMAYNRGERDDRVGAVASYYFEALWRMQQRTTVTDALFFPIILRYPDSFTINIRFASGYTTTESVHYESPEHLSERLEDEYAETYHEESNFTQRQAAEYLREISRITREEFPHPDESSFEERKYGGIVSAGGRKGTVFTSMLKRVEPDPDRFSEPVEMPTLVEEGAEARRTERELLRDGEVLL
ncbi:hypothetical protein [Halopelagius longus]|uniref:Uncharacterized protein n=1 Tax=Halopelagius longus TaxID=1236180 RepID=A0A1H0YHK9_9EURY|nr:hypothetical protein [Halopelagius longus]RDI72500.1 hypothetical protein DWB78_12650 [Halopelagius longus]SDQ14734.1 hypothetical protein SAMN05216278_0645 [Halopelagius longus]